MHGGFSFVLLIFLCMRALFNLYHLLRVRSDFHGLPFLLELDPVSSLVSFIFYLMSLHAFFIIIFFFLFINAFWFSC
jgi:hypothetical protein